MPVSLKRSDALYLLGFIALSILYACFATQVPLNSDAASALLEARDAAAGNLLLKGWNLSTVSFYFTEVLPYAVLIKLFGWHLGWAYLVPGMLLAAVVVVAARLIVRKRGISGLPPLVIIAAPGFFASNLLLVPCIHMGAYLAALLSWWLVETYEERQGRWRLVLLTLCLGLALFSDDIVRYVLLLPLGAAVLINGRRNPRLWWVIVSCVAAVLLAKLLALLVKALGGFTTPGLPPLRFASYTALWQNLELTLQGVLAFFDAEFFDQQIFSRGGLTKLFHAVVGFGFFGALYWIAKQRRATDTLSLGCLLGTAILLGAYVLSNLPVNLMTTRYLVPVFILGAVVLGRHLLSQGSVVALGSGIALAYAATILAVPKWDYATTNRNFPLAQALLEHNLKDGYATFWNAGINAVVSNAEISPVIIGAEGAKPYNWLSKPVWAHNGGSFLICDTEQQVIHAIHQLGVPEHQETIDGKFLLIWKGPVSLH